MSSPPPPPPPPPPSSINSGAFPPSSAVSPTSSTTVNGLAAGTLAGLVVGAGLGGAIVFIGAVIFFLWYRRRKKKEALRLAAGCLPPLDSSKKDGFNSGLSQNWHKNILPLKDEKVTLLPTSAPLPSGVLSDPQVSPEIIATSQQPLLTSGILDFEKSFPSPGIAHGLSQGMFTYEELAKATDGFSDANLIGQGGFGYVHKGMLQNGKLVAVKQLKSGGVQGEREFCAEIETISHVHHQHLVSLVGYCISGAQRLLVYEFVPNNSLEFHLHRNGQPTMNWSTRMRIALGAAKGLAYLHEDCQPKIIHRDIKAANILLDESFEAKVADFGLAKHSLDTDTHVSTRVMGTFGYLAPEYAASGKLTDKSDVFSFGVVLLELITGHRPVDRTQSFYDDSIVDWAMPLLKQALKDGKYDTLVDSKLQNDYDYSEMTRMIASAAACVRHSARLRPRMSQIVRALEGNISLDELNEGMPPGYSTIYTSYGSSDYTSSQYHEDLQKFRKMVLESPEIVSGEYSGLTSDYDQHPSSSSTDGQKQEATDMVEPQDLEKISEDSLKS